MFTNTGRVDLQIKCKESGLGFKSFFFFWYRGSRLHQLLLCSREHHDPLRVDANPTQAGLPSSGSATLGAVPSSTRQDSLRNSVLGLTQVLAYTAQTIAHTYLGHSMGVRAHQATLQTFIACTTCHEPLVVMREDINA